MKKNLLLINPAERQAGLGAYKSSSMPPLALAYIAALTPKDRYHIQIVDENIEPLHFPKADIVGITSYTAHIRRAYEISSKYRSMNVPVVMGGIHATMLPDEALNYCSSVVLGEAEAVWENVLDDFESGQLSSKYHGDRIGLDKLPFPDRSYLKNDSYLWSSIQTSRGCPMDCSFCSVTKFNGRQYRRRPINDVLKELSTIEKKFVLILDDNILGYGDKSWLYEFFTAIIRKKMKKFFYAQTSMKFGEDKNLVKLAYKAGLRVVLVGIESVVPETLKGYRKNLNASYATNNRYFELMKNIRRSGVAVLGCFMIGSDQDKLSTIKRTLDFIKKSHIDILQITKPTPLPGTKFFNDLRDEDRIMDTDYPDAWQHYRFTRMLYKPAFLEIDDVYEGVHLIKSEYYNFFSSLMRAFNTFSDTKSISTLLVSSILNRSYKKAWLNSDIYKKYDLRCLKEKFFN